MLFQLIHFYSVFNTIITVLLYISFKLITIRVLVRCNLPIFLETGTAMAVQGIPMAPALMYNN